MKRVSKMLCLGVVAAAMTFAAPAITNNTAQANGYSPVACLVKKVIFIQKVIVWKVLNFLEGDNCNNQP